MTTNGENTNYIKGIVKTVKRLFDGPAENIQKDTSDPCSTKNATPVYRKLLDENLLTIKAGLFLFGMLVISRLLPLPPNSEPLLGLAILTPYLTKNNMAFLLMPAVMLISDLFLGFGSWMWLTYPALMIATFISQFNKNKYTSLLGSWLVWHVLANTGQWFPPFSLEAVIFDLRLLVSGLGVVVLYDVIQKYFNTNLIYNK